MSTKEFQRRVIVIKNDILAGIAEYYANGGYRGTGGDGNYCKHGNYLGYWDGPDYMCGYCEDGLEDGLYAYYRAIEAVRREYQYKRNHAAQALANYFTGDFLKAHAKTFKDVLSDDEQRKIVNLLFDATAIIRGNGKRL